MATQLIYTVHYPTATPGTQDFNINISLENRSGVHITLKSFQIYLPMGEGDNDLTPVDDTSSIIADSPVGWEHTARPDKSGANLEVTFVYSIGSGIVIQPDDPALTFSLSNITVNDSFGSATCTLNEFTQPFVANSECDFQIPKPATPDQISFTANTYCINAGDSVVVTWAGPSGWVYAITYGSSRLAPTTSNNGSVTLPLLLSTNVTLQLTQAGVQDPPPPVQFWIEVTPTISLTGTVQPTLSNLYQLALEWTNLGASEVYGSWSQEPLGLSGSQIVALSYADVQSKSCTDYVLTAYGQDTEASCTCVLAPPVINSFAPELSQDANAHYYLILKWDVSGAFYVSGSWTTADSAPFNPIGQSEVIAAPFAPDYTITAYALSGVMITKTIQLADFFPAPVIQQFGFVIDGDALHMSWEVVSPKVPVFSLQGSWQPALSASLPLTGTLTLNSPFELVYTLTVEGLVEGQTMTQSAKGVLWRQSSSFFPDLSIPFAINFIDNQTYLVGNTTGSGPGEGWSGVTCYSTSKGFISAFATDGSSLSSMVITPNQEYLLTLDLEADMGNLLMFDVNTFTQTDPQPFRECELFNVYPELGSPPMVITPDNSSLYLASLELLTVVDLTQNLSSNSLQLWTEEQNPTDIAITPSGDYVLSVFSNGYVITVEVASFSQQNTIAVGQNPRSIAITPNSQYAFVACSGDDTVSVIDLSSFSVSGTLSVGAKPESLAITPDGRYVFVANAGSDTVSVIDANALTVVQTLAVGGGQKSIAITPDSSCVFVANSNSVSVISVNGLFVFQTFTLPETDMTTPPTLAVSPDGNTLVVGNECINLFVNAV